MGTVLDVINKRDEMERYGMDIKLDLPKTDLLDFRIAYENDCTQNTKEGVTVSTDKINMFLYSHEIEKQFAESGYYLKEVNNLWGKSCYYAYLQSEDEGVSYPKMKVYIHPNEMSGWAQKEDIDKLLKIAKSNSHLSNVRIAYLQKVYIMEDEQYLKILQEAEGQILAWLTEYQKKHRSNISAAAVTFQRIFGIKRLSVKRLSYKDYIAMNYIDQLIKRK